ncbi:probable L-gulonolactone oxidase 6 [Ziziphus jujuba]|uniref:L-gulonolactone oxidase n=1 Tax=Ziziphus jujuba TaxID=326968 RepID=A0A6P3YT67_ZIZJJ|nr:probable L-gulonolactone oxidase 6 [Ziziphus jujuba]
MSLSYPRNGVVGGLLLSTCLFLLFFMVCCTPEEPIQCKSENTDCTITNSYGTFPDRSVCRAQSVVYPTTEEELIAAVASATKNGSKIKVATRYSSSIPKLVCPSGQDGLLISTKSLNRILKIDKEAKTITVEPGVTLKELINGAANAGLALPYTPYWLGLTIGGLISTGSHGSTLWVKGSSVHDYVMELKIVSPGSPEDGYVKVRVLKDGDEDLDAARVSLGVLGVFSQVTLRLEPLFKRSITYKNENDSNLADQIVSFGRKHEFADIFWYPSQQKFVYRVDDRVPTSTSGNASYDFIPFRPRSSELLELIRCLEEGLDSSHNAEWKCGFGNLVPTVLSNGKYGLTDDGKSDYPMVGSQNRLQASGSCLEGNAEGEVEEEDEDAGKSYCPWDPRVKGEFFFQTTLSIGLSSVKNFIQDVQALVKLQPKALCGLEFYNGILMRYVTASSAYLGKEEDAVDFDITYYRSDDAMTPRLYQDFIEEIEQMALIKYGALPHWGKNRNIAFDGVIKKYKNADKFLAVKKLYDPMGLFSSEWTDQVLGLQGGITIFKEGCALEGLCICQEDIHCAPSKGYFCTHGKVFKDARVCSRQNQVGDVLVDIK